MTTITQVIHLDDDPVRRNLLITQSYHDLSSALAAQLGRENANWCTFATWASRTAGTFIRDEEIPRVVRLFLGKLKPIHVSLARLNDTLGETLGRYGRDFFKRHYTWQVIERKYLEMFDRLKREPVPAMTPLPGFFARRKVTERPAREVMNAIPSGPVVP